MYVCMYIICIFVFGKVGNFPDTGFASPNHDHSLLLYSTLLYDYYYYYYDCYYYCYYSGKPRVTELPAALALAEVDVKGIGASESNFEDGHPGCY